MAHTVDYKKPLLSRVRRIQGQLRSLENALDGEADCVAILQQIAAARGAINGLMAEVLEGHLRQHLVPAEGADSGDLDAAVNVMRSYLK
ncbi:MAG: metal/formaldehyde-sensitive transcriptional repressor [Pseudomonadota bacterium]|nr:metal/formaldehyde-sensitive transcriptional repressor [Pseudomonadota bacterium]